MVVNLKASNNTKSSSIMKLKVGQSFWKAAMCAAIEMELDGTHVQTPSAHTTPHPWSKFQNICKFQLGFWKQSIGRSRYKWGWSLKRCAQWRHKLNDLHYWIPAIYGGHSGLPQTIENLNLLLSFTVFVNTTVKKNIEFFWSVSCTLGRICQWFLIVSRRWRAYFTTVMQKTYIIFQTNNSTSIPDMV